MIVVSLKKINPSREMHANNIRTRPSTLNHDGLTFFEQGRPRSETLLGEVRETRVDLARHNRLDIVRRHLRRAGLVVSRQRINQPKLHSKPVLPLDGKAPRQ